MPKSLPLTKTELIRTLKDLKIVTQPELATTLKEMGVATKNDILASERRLKLRMGKMKNELATRIANLALTTPTSKEFEELKRKVEGNYTS